MADIVKLKKKAADLEAKKQLDKALDVYREIIEAYEAGDEDPIDIPLYNRVGDMMQKSGNLPEAVSIWERAVDHYTDGGFFNPAIALCNKILRQSPGRTLVYYKLGKIHAEKGFKGDARQNFLEYASRQQKAGNLNDAFKALKEFAELVPDQHDVRLMLADQLVKADRKDEAIEQLQLGFTQATADGLEDESEKFASKMKEIDPTVEPKAGDASSGGGGGGLVFLDVDEPKPRKQSKQELQRVTKAVEGLQLLTPETLAPPPAARATPTPAAPQPAVEPPEPEPPAAEPPVVEPPAAAAPPADEAPVLEIEPTVSEEDIPAPRTTRSDLQATSLGEDVSVEEIEVESLEVEATSIGEVADDVEIPVLEVEPTAHAESADAADEIELIEIQATAESPVPVAEPEVGAADADQDDEGDEDTEPVEEPPTVPSRATLAARAMAERLSAQVLAEDLAEAEEAAEAESEANASAEPAEAASTDAGPSGDEAVDAEREADADTEQPSAPAQAAADNSIPLIESESEMGEPGSGQLEVEPSVPSTSFFSDTPDGVGGEYELLDQSSVEPFSAEPPSAEEHTDGDAPEDEAPSVEEPSTAVSLVELRERVVQEPENWGVRRLYAELLLEQGPRADAIEELAIAMAGYEQEGDLDSAGAIAEEIVRLEPTSIRYHKMRVEYAFRANHRERLAEAYVELADALLADGQAQKARSVYQRVLDINPDDLRAQAAIEAIPEEEATPRASTTVSARASGTKDEHPSAPTPSSAPTPASAATPSAESDGAGGDDYISLGDWLREDDAPKSTRMVVEEKEPTGDEQADFEDMLKKFKEGVSANVEDEDHEAHYDLGVAYKEMGLLDEAIAEFQKALRGSAHRVRTYESLGHCFVEKGQLPVAATILLRALAEKGVGDESLVGVLYLLGAIAEEQQKFADAKKYYERVFAVDIQFRDVGERLNAVEQQIS
ncbi:MAG: tetratricopeptide repeat protein [Gemmatimonadaceae bacterium]|nr:tetratricopeptide repeat protein [Gemmatimonadaceae bacterium]